MFLASRTSPWTDFDVLGLKPFRSSVEDSVFYLAFKSLNSHRFIPSPNLFCSPTAMRYALNNIYQYITLVRYG